MYFDTGWLCGLPLTWTILHFCSWFLGCLQSLQAIAAELFARLLVSWFFFGICHWLLPHRSTAWCFGLGAVLGGLLADLASWSGASLCTFFCGATAVAANGFGALNGSAVDATGALAFICNESHHVQWPFWQG